MYSLIYGPQEIEMQNVQRAKAGLGGELAGKQRDFHVRVISVLLYQRNALAQSLQGELANLRAKSSASQQRVEEARASQAQNRSANAVLDSLTKLSQTGRVQGFHVSAPYLLMLF